MLGLADSNDPTPPIRLPRWPWRIGAVTAAVGLFEIVYGAIRVPADLVAGIIFLANGVMFVVLGVARIVSRRRAPGSDGGTADRP